MNNLPSQRRDFRLDVEGLRAIAVLLVLLYHAGVSAIPGGFAGVDIFFVISGFLITGLLLREVEFKGRLSLPRFYARRAKRLLPAAGLVLIVTTLLTWWIVPPVHFRTFGLDILGSATYVVNWILSGRSVDYLAEDVGVSPVQHFWSLAVEEQFYILWPLLIVFVAWLVRRRTGARLRPTLFVAIASVIVPSFILSVFMSATNPAVAFFVTPTRLWELGIGAVVAIGTTYWRKLSRTTSLVLGWGGVAAVLASGFVFTASTPWPGYAALLPTVGTALVIIGGFNAESAGAGRILSSRPAIWVGGLSYSLYLWHWPLLVAATYKWGELTTMQGLAIVGISFIPAWLGYKLLENPVRYAPAMEKSNRLALSVGANFSVVGLIAGLVLMLAVPVDGGRTPSAGESATGPGALHEETAGAKAGTVASLAEVDWFVPAPDQATKSIPDSYAEGCQQDQQDSAVKLCEWGDADADVTIAVVGDSKIVQWQSALAAIADEQGWKLNGYIKSACSFGTGYQIHDDGRPYTSCVEWNRAVAAELKQSRPDVVLVSNRAARSLSDPDDPSSLSREAMVEGLAEQWAGMIDSDIPVIAILDNPSPGMSVYECVAENPDDLASCAFDREKGIEESAAPVQRAAAEIVPEAQIVDMTDLICPAEDCVPIIGNILLYRQGSHLTDAYIRALTDDLAERLVPEVEEAVGSPRG